MPHCAGRGSADSSSSFCEFVRHAGAKVFNENSSKGYSKKLARDETTVSEFLKRADAILDKMTPEHKSMYVELVNPAKSSQPTEWLCQPTGISTKFN